MAEQQPDWFAANAPKASGDWFAANAPSAQKSTPTPVSADEPGTYWGGVGKSLKESALGTLRTLAKHPAETGAVVGGLVAAPLTGGASLLPAMAAAGLGGAGGAGLGMIAGAASGNTDLPNTSLGVLKTMGTQGAIQAAMEGGGRAISSGAEALGRGLYKAAVRPSAKLTERYGDLVGAGLEQGAPVGASRSVQGQMLASKGVVDRMAGDATAAGRSVPTQTVTDRYLPLMDKAANREALGVPGDFEEIATRERLFNAAHPSGQIDPTKALQLKREADTLANTAQNALRRGASVNDMTAQLHDATRSGLKQGLEAIAPGMADQNAKTSTLYGLSRALRSAENRPHGLTDLASIAAALTGGATGEDSASDVMRGAASGTAMRFLASPKVQSGFGIGSYAAKDIPYAQLVRLAMLAAMSNAQTPKETSR